MTDPIGQQTAPRQAASVHMVGAAVPSPAVQARFQVPAEDMHIAVNAPPHWFTIRLQREAQQNGEWVLTLGGLPLRNA